MMDHLSIDFEYLLVSVYWGKFKFIYKWFLNYFKKIYIFIPFPFPQILQEKRKNWNPEL